MKRTKEQKGITLVALIITIIVLLILAVVAIRAVQGDGIIAHAKNARDNYNQAQIEENGTIQNYVDYITGQLGEGSGGGNTTNLITADKLNKVLNTTANTSLLDKYGNKITVPAGFKIVVDNGTDASKSTNYTVDTIDITKGIVIEDGVGNQFVWIPVGKIYTDAEKTDANVKIISLTRSAFGDNDQIALNVSKNLKISRLNKKSVTSRAPDPSGGSGMKCTEDTRSSHNSDYPNAIARDIEAFKTSVEQNGGYYLGRYEASSYGETIAVKANQDVYVNITQPDASAKSQSMYADRYSSGTYSSDLVNSYAWDTAIIFIQAFGTEADASNYASQNKSTSFTKTGVNSDKYCNIYDLSGNAYEWTTETADGGTKESCVKRGGYYHGSIFSHTSSRAKNDSQDKNEFCGFRPLIYMALNA